jgi:hypothetical protein
VFKLIAAADSDHALQSAGSNQLPHATDDRQRLEFMMKHSKIDLRRRILAGNVRPLL